MKNKKKSKLFLLILLILGISIGFALLSTTLSIIGTAGIKGGKWDIHWDDESVVVSQGSVSSSTPVVSGTNYDTVTFSSTLELPGDYFEFTVDAVNEGSVDGMIDDINTVITDGNDDPVEFEDYIHLIVTYDDGTPIARKQLLKANSSEKYKVRIEFDEDAEEVPENDITYNISYQVTYVPADDTAKPVRYAVFGLGPDVNQKLKVLAGNTLDSENPIYTQDSNVTAIVRSDTAPSSSNMTDEHIVSLVTSKTPIYAWYENGTIYYYSESEYLKFSESTSYMFSGFTSLTSIDLSEIDSSDVTNIYGTLNNDRSLVTANLSNFNFSSWNAGSLMSNFGLGWGSGIKTLILDKAIFPINMGSGLCNLEELERISLKGVDTSNVVNMGSMFYNDPKLTTLDLSNWDTSNVINMNNVFSSCTKLETINFKNWDTSKVTDMSSLFYGCSSLIGLDLSYFRTSSVTNMAYMFENNTSLETINMSNFDFAGYHPSYVLSCMGISNSPLKTIIMNNSKIYGDVSGFFSYFNDVETISLDNMDTSNATNMTGFFRNCSKLTSIDVSSFNTSNVTSMQEMFYGCSNLKSLDLSNFDILNVTYLYGIVGSCGKLTDINMSNWDFSNYDTENFASNIYEGSPNTTLKNLKMDNAVFNTSMKNTFRYLTALESISLKNVDTSKTTTMEDLFAYDSSLTTLDVSSFNTSRVTDMSGMFERMDNLETIYVGNGFNVNGVTRDGNMFYNSTKLVGGNGTVYDSSHVDKVYARIDASNTPGYFSTKN